MSWQDRCNEARLAVGGRLRRGAEDVTLGEVCKPSLLGATGLLAVATSLYAAPGIAGLAGAGLGLIMLAVAVIDARRLMIPDELSALALALGLADVGFERWPEMPAPMLEALIRAAATAAVFFAFRLAYRRWRGREGMGLGDVKLAGVAGIWIDWPSLPIAVEIAALGALVFVAWLRIGARRAPDPLDKLPFGAFFAPAIWMCWALERWSSWTL
jgi:leader peptidase (prepilin peptidase) / N-methyltransferase